MQDNSPLRILHVLRSPVGGLFRHVMDVARGQIERGHAVGIVADSSTGGDRAEKAFRDIGPDLRLGLSRTPMPRQFGLHDFTAAWHVGRAIRALNPDVVHAHGAKAAAYARIAAPSHRAIRVYTPHGGSLHYDWSGLSGRMYLTLETLLNKRTDLFLFESEFIHALYRRKIGEPAGLVRIARNGVTAADLADAQPDADAKDLLFVGELRDIKGIDVLLDAIAALRRAGMAVSAAIVGDGPDRDALQAQAQRLGLGDLVHFHAPMPIRAAMRLGRIAVVPSRNESLPYVVLEYAAAGVPLIATHVGGIPEIFGPDAARLIPPGDAEALSRTIRDAVKAPETLTAFAADLRKRIRATFSVKKMIDDGLSAYREVIASKSL